MEKESRHLFHYNSPESKRRLTVCGVVKNNQIHFGYTICSPKDAFTRKRGREIAVGRAIKRPIVTVPIIENQPLGKSFYRVATAIAEIVEAKTEGMYSDLLTLEDGKLRLGIS